MLASLLGLGFATACATASNSSDGGVGASDGSPVSDGATSDAARAIDAAGIADASVAVDAAPPDANVPPAPDAGCTPATVALLANPSFDLGPGGGWIESSSGGFAIVVPATDPGITPDTAPEVGWLGGYDNAVDLLTQDFLVPAGATNLTITGKRFVFTSETATVTQFDHGAIELRRASDDAVLTPIAAASNLDAGASWVAFSASPAQSHAGEILRLAMRVDTDFSNPTSFLFDSLSVTVSACP